MQMLSAPALDLLLRSRAAELDMSCQAFMFQRSPEAVDVPDGRGIVRVLSALKRDAVDGTDNLQRAEMVLEVNT